MSPCPVIVAEKGFRLRIDVAPSRPNVFRDAIAFALVDTNAIGLVLSTKMEHAGDARSWFAKFVLEATKPDLHPALQTLRARGNAASRSYVAFMRVPCPAIARMSLVTVRKRPHSAMDVV
mmetsp:Transcript_3928/g.7148  ORF Transcript_3928/g.7148 Transcript_3928/m.7148 type:complete len:120 (+) Transcript_3928:2120-2479(+)